MESSARLDRGRLSSKARLAVVVALSGALLLGGAGGYAIGALNAPHVSGVVTSAKPQQAEPQKAVPPDWAYRDHAQPMPPQEMLDPNGYVIHH
jgi:hypothetical protein